MNLRCFKKIIAAVCAFSLCLCLFACGERKCDISIDSDKPLVIATLFPYYDFARQILGDCVELHLLVPPGTDSHSYEPTPKEVALLRECDLFIYTGGTEDGIFEELLASLEAPVDSLRLIDLVEPLCEEEHDHSHSHSHSHDHDHEHGEYDPHVWTSPKNALLICDAIAQAATDFEGYEPTRHAEYSAKLTALDGEFRELFSENEKPLIFADRFPFRYFAAEYGIEYHSAFPGCADYTEPSARTVAKLLATARAHGVSTVFHTEGSDLSAAKVMAEELGGSYALLHSCHRVTRAELDGGITYLSVMTENLKTLTEVFNADRM